MDDIKKSKYSVLAKNTILLYIRQFFMMAIGLFTSRVILKTLGIEDYGVYNVVGGVVAMFSIITSSLGTAISRFLSVEMGKGATHNLCKVFSTSLTVQFLMAIVVTLLLEVFGVWFLNTHLNIPADRLEAANWVFQSSIFTFAISIIIVPYNASIIAHERMDFFAYVSILEAVLKLAVVYVLYVSPFDKLSSYGMLILLVKLIMFAIYGLYCKRTFAECNYRFVFDKKLIKEISGFAGWNFFGSAAYIFNTEGVNIATNMFFGVTANAARGVANQVEGIMKQFVGNFTTALNPQIMKSYASKDMDYLYELVCRGAKFSFFLMLLFAVPFIYSTEWIMHVWLDEYPPEAPLFLRLSLIGTMLDLLGNTAAFAVWATGKLKKYYLYVATMGALVFPISLLLFYIGLPAYVSYIIFAIIYFILIFIRLWILHCLISIPYGLYFKGVLLKIASVSFAAFSVPYIFYRILGECSYKPLILIMVSLISTAFSILVLGINKEERKFLKSFLSKK